MLHLTQHSNNNLCVLNSGICTIAVTLNPTVFGREPIARTNDGNLDQQTLIILDDREMQLPVDGIISEWRLYVSNPGTIRLMLWRRTVDQSQFELISMVTLDLPGDIGGVRNLKSSDYFTPHGTKKDDVLGLWFEDGSGISFDGSSDCSEGDGRVYVVTNVRPEDLILGRSYTAIMQQGAMACRNYSIEITVIKRKQDFGLY